MIHHTYHICSDSEPHLLDPLSITATHSCAHYLAPAGHLVPVAVPPALPRPSQFPVPESDEEDDPEDLGENRTRVLPATEFRRTGALYQSEGIDELIGALHGHPRCHSPVRDLFTIHSVVTPATVDLDSILDPSAGGAVWSANFLAVGSSAISDGPTPPTMVGRPGRRPADVTALVAEDRFLGHFDIQRTSELGSASNTSRPQQLSAGFSSAFLDSSSSGGPGPSPCPRRQMSESGRPSRPPINQRSSLGRLQIHEETSPSGTCSGNKDGEAAEQSSARRAVHSEVVTADEATGARGGSALFKKNNTKKTVMVGLKGRRTGFLCRITTLCGGHCKL